MKAQPFSNETVFDHKPVNMNSKHDLIPGRRTFLYKSVAFGAMLPLAPVFGAARPALSADQLPAEMVNEFVRVAHSDFGRVKALLEEQPHLLNAAWDWGDGDFETAIGAAGHMGLREMASYLLEKGARADIFVLTMLGETALVKAMLDRFPYLLNSLGPHGYTLLHPARQGGEQATELFDFLSEKGLVETHVKYFSK